MARKTKTLSIEERINGAAATRDAALSVFQAAADDLMAAEAEALAAAEEADLQADYYRGLAIAATNQANRTADRGNAIRDLLGL